MCNREKEDGAFNLLAGSHVPLGAKLLCLHSGAESRHEAPRPCVDDSFVDFRGNRWWALVRMV